MGPCLWGTEYCDRSAIVASVTVLQWGRAFGARNTNPLNSSLNQIRLLQWGRAFGARNTFVPVLLFRVAISASMGPCLWGTEYVVGDLHSGFVDHSFNGAVPLGHGIRPDAGIRQGQQVASMGPCLWGTEYSSRMRQTHWSDSRLQWGRAFGARNTSPFIWVA